MNKQYVNPLFPLVLLATNQGHATGVLILKWSSHFVVPYVYPGSFKIN